jgi:acetyltransferase EpsM
MKDITLYGAGGHCFATIELIRSLGQYKPLLILDDNPKTNEILGLPVQKYDKNIHAPQSLCITIGDNKLRKKIANLFRTDFPSFVHDSAQTYPSVTIGEGTLVLPNAVLDASVSLGKHNIINSNATVSHNVQTGDFVHIAIQAAIAGGVTIGEGTLIGAGSIILPEINIGKWVIIGAGSVITKDIPDNSVVYGNPGVIKKQRKEE